MAQTDQTWAAADRCLVPRIWNTETVPKAEAFDYYRDGICAAFMPLRPELDRSRRAGFVADLASYDLDGSVLNVVSARSHAVLRRRSEIAASTQDCHYLNLQIGGECRIRQHGTTVTLRPGDVGIFDSGTAFDLHHDRRPALRVASLMVPKDRLRDISGAALPALPLLLSRHPVLGPLVAEAARSLVDAVGWASAAELARLHSVLLSLVAMSAAQPGHGPGPETRAAAQLARIKRIIRRSCTTAGYGAADCAAEAGLTQRHVHRLFSQDDTTFGAFLLSERLQRAARILSSPGQAHMPVSSVAYETGFRDPSHFSRAFRRQYGLSPGAWRQDTPPPRA